MTSHVLKTTLSWHVLFKNQMQQSGHKAPFKTRALGLLVSSHNQQSTASASLPAALAAHRHAGPIGPHAILSAKQP